MRFTQIKPLLLAKRRGLKTLATHFPSAFPSPIPQLWSSGQDYGDRDPRVPIMGSEPGLIALWKFDEGRGTVSVDSVTWRSQESATSFGVIIPAAAINSTAASLLGNVWTKRSEGVDRLDAPPATWAVSAAPVGGFVRSDDARPISLRVNGSDAHVRPLLAVLTAVPSGGSLVTVTSVGTDEANEDQVELGIGDVIPVGTKLLYRPDTGAHDPWLEGIVGEYAGVSEWAAEGEPYDWFSYRVETEGGEASTNEVVVALSVRPALNAPHLDWPVKVSERAWLLTSRETKKQVRLTPMKYSYPGRNVVN